MQITARDIDTITLTQETDSDIPVLSDFVSKAGLYCGQQMLRDGRIQIITTVGAVTKIALGIPLN